MKEAPRVLAKYFLGAGSGTPTFADLRGTHGSNDVIIAARAKLTAYDSEGHQLWESNPEGYVMDHVEWVEDLDGDGQNEVVAVAGHMGMTRQAYLILDGRSGRKRAAIDINTGDFSWRGHLGPYLPGQKGKQIFIVTSMRQAESGIGSYGQFSLWAYDGKGVTNRWAWSPTEHVIYYPAVMVADLDGNGRYEAVVDSWCHVWDIDLATGQARSHTDWDPGGANHRQYGWNEVIDVNGDGKLDFVNVSLTKHVDVLTNANGKLQLAWARGWPDPVTTEARSLHCPSDPVVDLDGDKKMEVMTGLYEGLGDKKWHLFIFDAASGKERTNMVDRVPVGSAPLWGTNNGAALFCVYSTNLEYDPPQAYEIWRLTNGALERIWNSLTDAFVVEMKQSDDRRAFYFNATKLEWPVTGDTGADGRVEFFTRPKNSLLEAKAWGADASGQIVRKQGQPGSKSSHSLPKDIPPLQGATVPFLLAGALEDATHNDILLYDNNEITVLRLEGEILNRVEKVPSTEIPIICDLLGDGQAVLLTGGRGNDGNLWVQARDSRKHILWRYTFPHSGACGQYSERPHYFAVGYFTGEQHLDVFTYSSKPAARTYVLNGLTGQPVWEREQLPAIERHFQPLGGRVSVLDVNHDGADDILFCNPDYYCVANGKTGDLLAGPASITELIKWWAAYASPAPLEQNGKDPMVYLGGAYSSRGGIALDGKSGLWHEFLPTERWPLRPGNCGFNEGLLPPTKTRPWRGAQIESDGTLVCFDAVGGKIQWKMPLPTAAYGVCTGDINGDGEPDLLIGGQDGNLIAIADKSDHAEVLWRKHFEGPVSTPILADANNDGKSEIIMSVGDGYIYVLGK